MDEAIKMLIFRIAIANLQVSHQTFQDLRGEELAFAGLEARQLVRRPFAQLYALFLLLRWALWVRRHVRRCLLKQKMKGINNHVVIRSKREFTKMRP